MSRYLLVVATRGYVPRGQIPEDEFCSQWGFPKDQDYKWFFERDHVALLVLHGCKSGDKEFDPAAAIEKAAADSEFKQIIANDKLAKGVFYYHSIGNTVEVVSQAIKNHLTNDLLTSRRYESRGGLAIDELNKDIRSVEVIEAGVRARLVEAIEMAAAGRPLFVAKLRTIQSALIRFRLLLDVAKIKPQATGLADQIQAAGVDLAQAGEGSRGKFKQWLQWLDEQEGNETLNAGKEERTPEAAATKILRFLGGGPAPEGLLVPKVWGALRDPKTVITLTKHHFDELITDIRLVARATDVLLEASERLPQTLSVKTNEPKSQATGRLQ